MEELILDREDKHPSKATQVDEEFARLQQEQNAVRFAAVSTGTYFWHGLLYAIPVIGWIACIVAAFVTKNVSHRNFARATLIRIVLGILALCLATYLVIQFASSALMGLLGLFTGTSPEDMQQMTDKIESVQQEMQEGKYDEFLEDVGGEHPELENVLGGIKQEGLPGLMEQLKGEDAKDMIDKYINGEYNDLFDRLENGEFGDMGALGDLYHSISGGMQDGKVDYVDALYTAITTGKSVDGVDAEGLAVLTQIYKALDDEQKAMLADAMEDYREIGYKRVLEKYTNGDYDELLDDFKSGKYGDITPLIQRLMTIYIMSGLK